MPKDRKGAGSSSDAEVALSLLALGVALTDSSGLTFSEFAVYPQQKAAGKAVISHSRLLYEVRYTVALIWKRPTHASQRLAPRGIIGTLLDPFVHVTPKIVPSQDQTKSWEKPAPSC